MKNHSRVLIIHSSADTRLVLRMALERRGMEILEADAASQGVAIAQTSPPDLVVVDLEEVHSDTEISMQNLQNDKHEPVSFVYLGNVQRSQAVDSFCTFVSKPYHYQPLVSTIEDMLAKRHAA